MRARLKQDGPPVNGGESSPFRASGSDNNHDWQQGVFDAALLGLVDDAVRLQLRVTAQVKHATLLPAIKSEKQVRNRRRGRVASRTHSLQPRMLK
jgi:hypothetical protein